LQEKNNFFQDVTHLAVLPMLLN